MKWIIKILLLVVGVALLIQSIITLYTFRFNEYDSIALLYAQFYMSLILVGVFLENLFEKNSAFKASFATFFSIIVILLGIAFIAIEPRGIVYFLLGMLISALDLFLTFRKSKKLKAIAKIKTIK